MHKYTHTHTHTHEYVGYAEMGETHTHTLTHTLEYTAYAEMGSSSAGLRLRCRPLLPHRRISPHHIDGARAGAVERGGGGDGPTAVF